ncbi:MAG TPA: diguanylate cyclase [Acetobacteraceae bacterium]|nr:diguanylate cyclase [Acetobacteraceae bacterium]
MHDAAADPGAPGTSRTDEPLHGALLDSRQRWRDLVSLAADFAFETDASGRFTLIMPDPALGWSAAELIGQPSGRLLAPLGGAPSCNPFHPDKPMRGRRAWIRRADGSFACVAIAAAPLRDAAGRVVGGRGLAMDVTDQDGQEAAVAAALRRGAVTDDILSRMRQEVLAPRMMRAVLDELISAVGAEGAAVITDGPLVLHQSGAGAGGILNEIAVLLEHVDPASPAQITEAGGHQVLVSGCQTRFGEKVGLVLWRANGQRGWDGDDRMLVGSIASIVRVVLEHQSIQREMARQARTDPLTGLLNRRAFLDELPRHIDRLEREQLPGTLVFADLDNFKVVNDARGHELGDQVLCRAAQLLRKTVRPTDLVARLGGDEFAIWLNGADHFTAAERAETLRVEGPAVLADVIGSGTPVLGFSIGIASRRPGEEIDSVMRRADLAMYQVKRDGRGHWRVAQE